MRAPTFMKLLVSCNRAFTEKSEAIFDDWGKFLILTYFKHIYTMTSKENPQFIIRNLHYNDIPELISLPRLEGREMGQESEISTWLSIDPHGIFIAVNIEDGHIAGCCSGIALSETHGYIGMFVVKDIYRGLGLGRILWQAAVNRLGNRNTSLSSVAKMLSFYRDKAGFSLSAEWTVDLYTATEPCLPSARYFPFTFIVSPKSPFIQNVIAYDCSIHKYDRSRIVEETINEPGTITVTSLKVSTSFQLESTGYACMKKGLQGHWLIAPVYADDYSTAKSLVYSLLSALTYEQRKEGVVAKLVSSNCEAIKLFYEFGLKRSTYQLHRLFTKEVFEIPEKKIFALQTSVFCTE